MEPLKIKQNGCMLSKRDSFNDDSDELSSRHKRIESKMSYEESIYDIITEIPHYFGTDNKFKDDNTIIDIKTKRSNTKKENVSRSVGRKKKVGEGVKRKSILYCNGVNLFNNTNTCSSSNIKPLKRDFISEYETYIQSEKAYFKLEDDIYGTYTNNGNNNSNATCIPGTAYITDYRFYFVFDDRSVDDKVGLTEDFFSIPLFSIAK
jgi:hypothetical protein